MLSGEIPGGQFDPEVLLSYRSAVFREIQPREDSRLGNFNEDKV